MTTSRALCNRSRLDLASDETVAQVFDRGTIDDWRALWQLARGDAALRARIKRVVATVPLPLPRFSTAALASVGEWVDYDATPPEYAGGV